MAESPRSDIVILGASAGGLDVLRTITRGLPADLPAAVFIVIHLSPDQSSSMAEILAKNSDLDIRAAHDGDRVQYGTALVAPPDHHVTFEDSVVRVLRGPRVNAHRPSIDVTFRSAATRFGARVVGVVLTGGLDDGTDGLRYIKRLGGCAVVQDPKDAEFDSMPRSAMEHVAVDRVLPSHEIASALIDIVTEGGAAMSGQQLPRGTEEPTGDQPSAFVCPECEGTLFETKDGGWTRFRCRVGHAYSTESLVLNKDASLEAALWTAARALREQADLFDRLALSGADRPANDQVRKRFESRAAHARDQGRVIEKAIATMERAPLTDDLDELNRAGGGSGK